MGVLKKHKTSSPTGTRTLERPTLFRSLYRLFFFVFSYALFQLDPYFFVLVVLHFALLSLLTRNNTNIHAGIEPATPASNRPHTPALDRSVPELPRLCPVKFKREIVANAAICDLGFHRQPSHQSSLPHHSSWKDIITAQSH